MIAIDIDYLIDQLEELRDQGIQVPFTNLVMIDQEKFLRLINQLRISVPREVQEARQVTQERDRIIAQAQERAQNIIALAEQQAAELVSDHAIAQRAASREQELLEEARREAENIRAEADAYALQVLEALQQQLERFQRTVRNGIALLREGRLEAPAAQEAEASLASEEEAEEAPVS